MEMRLPVLPLLVELTMDSTYYDCASRPGAEELVADAINESFWVETLDFRSRDNPIFMHKRNELELYPGGWMLNTEQPCGVCVKPDAHATDAYGAGRT
jgi:hypothetical protein